MRHQLINKIDLDGIVFFKCCIFRKLLIFAILIFLSVSCAPPAEEKGPEEEVNDIEPVLETLNDALDENKKLRDNVVVVQDALERLTIENNVLQSRNRSLEKRIEELEINQDEVVNVIRQKQTNLEDMEARAQTLTEERDELQKRLDELMQMNKNLQKILDTAILETEADEYRRLLSNFREQSETAVNALAMREKQNERLRRDLGDALFRLGNVMFENKNYAGSLRYYKSALEWDPSKSEAHHNLGIVYDFYLEDHQLALYHYKKYLNLKSPEMAASEIRERIIDLELLRKLVPTQPLKLDFNEHHSTK